MTDVLRAEFDLSLFLDGLGEFKVAQFSSDFSFNQIPRAMCVLATGRLASDGQTPAKIHANLDAFVHMMKAEVRLRPSGEWNNELDWPEEETRIFDGRLLGTGFQKISGKVQFVVYLTHWLADMNFSSSLSSNSHPSNPSQYTFSAVVESLIKSGLAGGKPYLLSQTAEADSINFQTVREDLWARALKPLFCALAEEKHVRISGELAQCVQLVAGNNEQALSALKRIEGEIGAGDAGEQCSLERSCFTPALSMEFGDDADAIPQEIADAISQTIRRQTIESFAQSTLWGKLVGTIGPQFMFSVVPLVERALVVPFMPGIRQTYCKVISSGDYNHIDLPAELKRPIRAVAIYNGKEMITNLVGGGQSSVRIAGVGGCFAPDDATDQGMIYFQRGPSWLDNIPSSGISAGNTLGINGRIPASTVTTPRANKDDGLKGGDVDREQRVTSALELYNGYAHALFVIEALRGRTGILSGKLRFDISPCSNVKIFGTTEKFLSKEEDLQGRTIIGTVLRVSTVIDAEASRAGTAFQLGYVRTEQENRDDKTSVDNHPLYTTRFLGAPMVDEYWFSEENQECCDLDDGAQAALAFLAAEPDPGEF